MATECVNLMEQFGKRYRIGWDLAYDPKCRPRDKLDPWMMTIPCERGEVYPHGDDLLAVDIDNRPITAKRLAKAGFKLVKDGDHEKTFIFDVADFEAVAAIVKPRKRRQMSEEQKRQAVARLAEFQYQPCTSDVSSGSKTAQKAA